MANEFNTHEAKRAIGTLEEKVDFEGIADMVVSACNTAIDRSEKADNIKVKEVIREEETKFERMLQDHQKEAALWRQEIEAETQAKEKAIAELDAERKAKEIAIAA